MYFGICTFYIEEKVIKLYIFSCISHEHTPIQTNEITFGSVSCLLQVLQGQQSCVSPIDYFPFPGVCSGVSLQVLAGASDKMVFWLGFKDTGIHVGLQ